jgi:hypothetical protein
MKMRVFDGNGKNRSDGTNGQMAGWRSQGAAASLLRGARGKRRRGDGANDRAAGVLKGLKGIWVCAPSVRRGLTSSGGSRSLRSVASGSPPSPSPLRAAYRLASSLHSVHHRLPSRIPPGCKCGRPHNGAANAALIQSLLTHSSLTHSSLKLRRGNWLRRGSWG